METNKTLAILKGEHEPNDIEWQDALHQAIRWGEEKEKFDFVTKEAMEYLEKENEKLKKQIETLEIVPLSSKFFREFKAMKKRLAELPSEEELISLICNGCASPLKENGCYIVSEKRHCCHYAISKDRAKAIKERIG